MKIVDEIIQNIAEEYPLSRICNDPGEILFIDIETTGLSPKSSMLYLIGCAYFRNDAWHLRQYFADKRGEEDALIKAFMEFARDFKVLLHFNGDRFDLPFIKFKCERFRIRDVLDDFKSIDIYKRLAPYKNILGIPDCKQKTIELFLGIDRTDVYTGGELIRVYKDYLIDRNEHYYDLLMLHNADDVRGMFALLPALYYHDLFQQLLNQKVILFKTDATVFPQVRTGFSIDESSDNENPDAVIDLPIRAMKVQANYYNDINGVKKEEILMKVSLPDTLPSSVGGTVDGCYFKAEGDSATIRIPLLEAELKYFYNNYKDYYYLPAEDQALHKSVAQFVDKSHREQATAANCYTRKPGQYLKEWDAIFSPIFRWAYNDKSMYFELTDEIKQSRAAMSLYAVHVLAHIIANA
ncbi:ribonuclease H-like domain-containing protein [Butyrivibrio sp. VCD2006]|uniref:ribonuclease H-like domain-containing protein n=1 Tax=Butyrivibrio sp. VCD2006 TaxID=1280664 RepID=UPI00041EAD7E|nr:ribonuclease H-like domain-containing protein [Butyrivibrio sp. VCD2006]